MFCDARIRLQDASRDWSVKCAEGSSEWRCRLRAWEAEKDMPPPALSLHELRLGGVRATHSTAILACMAARRQVYRLTHNVILYCSTDRMGRGDWSLCAAGRLCWTLAFQSKSKSRQDGGGRWPRENFRCYRSLSVWDPPVISISPSSRESCQSRGLCDEWSGARECRGRRNPGRRNICDRRAYRPQAFVLSHVYPMYCTRALCKIAEKGYHSASYSTCFSSTS